MKTLGDIGLVIVVILAGIIGGSIVVAILFSIWVISTVIRLLKIQKPLTLKEFLNL